MQRAIGALVLVCLAMITAAPLAAVSIGGECEKQCCQRKNAAHACCKRAKAADGLTVSAARERCCAGNANIGLARFPTGAGIGLVALDVAPLVEWDTAMAVTPERGESPGSEHALFERPPPAV